jgi:hypothetical protein
MYANAAEAWNANLLAPFRLLHSNDFEPIRIQKVEAELEIVLEDRTAAVREMSLDRHHVRAGESLRCKVTLDRFGDVEDPTVELEFPIPEDLPPGPYEMVVAGGKETLPQLPAPRSPDQIATWIRNWYRANQIVIQVAVPRLRLTKGGMALDGLPPSIAAALLDPASSGEVSPVVEELRVAKETPWVIQGRQSIPIVVEKRRDN